MVRAIGLALLSGGLFLAACADTGVRPTGNLESSADSADQILLGMTTQITDKGVLRSFVEADTAYIYQNPQYMDLRRFTVRMLDGQGNLQSTLTAARGRYESLTGKLDARGNVVVVSPDGRKLVTAHLIYDKTANQISSDSAFTYEGPDGTLSGNGFTSDTEFKNVGVLQPRGTQKGRGILLPGQ
jgi:LPS export ABC transporter protein LptC